MKNKTVKIVKKDQQTKSAQEIRVVLRGLVVAAKQPKTVTVLVERRKLHPLYKKSFIRSKKYLVHDEIGVKVGDLVDLRQVKPISKNKHFQIARVVGKDIEAIITEQIQKEAEETIAQILPEEKKEETTVDSLPTTDEKVEKKVMNKRKEKK